MSLSGLILCNEQLTMRLQRRGAEYTADGRGEPGRRAPLPTVGCGDQPDDCIHVLRWVNDKGRSALANSIARPLFDALPNRIKRAVQRDPISIANPQVEAFPVEGQQIRLLWCSWYDGDVGARQLADEPAQHDVLASETRLVLPGLECDPGPEPGGKRRDRDDAQPGS